MLSLVGHCDWAFLRKETYFNWKFAAEYGTRYLIVLQHNSVQNSFIIMHSFVFIPFLRNRSMNSQKKNKCNVQPF